MSEEPSVERTAPAGKPSRKTVRVVFITLIALVVIAAVVSGLYVFHLANSFDSQTQKIAVAFPADSARPQKPATGQAADAVNILLLGSDSRAASSQIAEQGGASDQRSDSMMWIHIPADRKNVYVMSIMRDTWVDIPGYGEAKINAAMAYGGVPLVVQTLEGIFGSRIDHVVMADFEGFKAITDAVGGVEVDVPIAFTTENKSVHLNAGKQKLNGQQALAFVRERYAFVDGDYQRVKDQQIFMKALFNTLLTPQTLSNPFTINTLVNSLAPNLAVDKGFNASAVGALLISLRDVRSSNVTTFTLPTLGTGTSADGQSIVLKDPAAIAAIGKALKSDTMGSYVKELAAQ